jgi:glucose-1-phosphate thymidylyltransferase
MKGIILAGGKGTRLYPVTRGVSKQALPLFDKPLIFYPLSTLMLAGIHEILVIVMPQDRSVFERMLEDGNQWGIRISYAEQPVARGLADAYIVGHDFVEHDHSCLILGDNFMFGHDLNRTISKAISENTGATIFATEVKDPGRYGIVELDSDGRPVSIEEKPTNPKSKLAVPGLYIYDPQVVDIVRILKPSARGELEITDVNRAYLELGALKVVPMGRGTAWLDAGTHEALLQASQFVQTVQERQGLMIACLEEIAFQQGRLTRKELALQAEKYKGNSYGEYLARLLERDG